MDTKNYNETPQPKIVTHESGVAMGQEAFDTGKHPEGAVSKTAIPVVVNKPAEHEQPTPVDVDNVSA